MFIAALFITAKKRETTQMSIANKWIVYSYNRISFGQKEKWGTDAFYNVHEPWEHHTEKPVIKEHVLYDSLSIKCPKAKLANLYSSLVFAKQSGGRGVGNDCRWVRGFLLRWWKCSKMWLWWWLHNCSYSKVHWILYFKRVNFMVCDWYLNTAI